MILGDLKTDLSVVPVIVGVLKADPPRVWTSMRNMVGLKLVRI